MNKRSEYLRGRMKSLSSQQQDYSNSDIAIVDMKETQ